MIERQARHAELCGLRHAPVDWALFELPCARADTTSSSASLEGIFEDVFKEIASAALVDRGAPHHLRAGARTAPDHRTKQASTGSLGQLIA